MSRKDKEREVISDPTDRLSPVEPITHSTQPRQIAASDLMNTDTSKDEKYIQILIKALRTCTSYKPMFGRGRKGGVTLDQFQTLYRADPFYNWIGLDSPLMYAAHKAAGGMTSIYRQIGIGCQWVFSTVIQDHLNLSSVEANWRYEVPGSTGKARTLYLDGRIDLAHIKDANSKQRVEQWITAAKDKLQLPSEYSENIKGAVFEVRQGYKSKDSKRQNADIANAATAYTHLYLPVLMVLSTQIDGDVALRYTQNLWLLLVGTTGGQSTDSTYVFCRDVIGYDLAGFFERNSALIKTELEKVLSTLLKA